MDLKQALQQSAEYLLAKGVVLPLDVISGLYSIGIKTADGFARSVRGAVRLLYDGKIDKTDFIGQMDGFIESQLTTAWFEGMAANELTRADMTEEWELYLARLIQQEKEFVYGFSLEIEAASLGLSGEVKPIDPFLVRADLWGNRYNDVVNEATIMTAEAGTKMVWQFGDTEHCDTCLELNGIVAFVKEWNVAGVRPQSPPNDHLDCGGWRCQCQLIPTTERRTPNAFGRILNAMR